MWKDSFYLLFLFLSLTWSYQSQQTPRIAVIGGGASGMFAATAAANEIQNKCNDEKNNVIVFESTKRIMTKVSISGGGRCNVLHDTQKPTSELLSCYPRGSKELTGLFSKHFTPIDAQKWFESEGVILKTEDDGRMFPITDSSQTIMDAIYNAAERAGVKIWKNCPVSKIEQKNGKFQVYYLQECMEFDSVILATGSSKIGYEIAQSLGHSIVDPVPSLFTLSSKSHVSSENSIFHDLAGISVPLVTLTLKVKVPGKKKKQMIQQEGPLLMTHYGISGPAALRLSAFAAHEFHNCNYETTDLTINWIPHDSFYNVNGVYLGSGGKLENISDLLWKQRLETPKKYIGSVCPLFTKHKTSLLPKRLWSALVQESGISNTQIWADLSKKQMNKLSQLLWSCPYHVTGKGLYKDEFVTAGGILLREMKMDQMASKVCDGLFGCGEVLNVDGITGGFNFMNCWSTGYIAGISSANFILK